MCGYTIRVTGRVLLDNQTESSAPTSPYTTVTVARVSVEFVFLAGSVVVLIGRGVIQERIEVVVGDERSPSACSCRRARSKRSRS